jgi:hypothetical protein
MQGGQGRVIFVWAPHLQHTIRGGTLVSIGSMAVGFVVLLELFVQNN